MRIVLVYLFSMQTREQAQRLFLGVWKLFRGTEFPKEAARAHQEIELFHGVSSQESSEAWFDPLLILGLSRTIQREEGTPPRYQAIYPVYFFLPANLRDWVKEGTLRLGKGAMTRLGPIDSPAKSLQRSLVKEALGQVRWELRPWVVEKEPARWVAFGFKKEAPFLPKWLGEKLVDT